VHLLRNDYRSLRNRCAIAAKSLQKHKAISAQSRRNHGGIAARSLRDRWGIAGELLLNRCEILSNHSAVAGQSLGKNRCEILSNHSGSNAQSMQNRNCCATTSQWLYNRCAITARRYAINTNLLSLRSRGGIIAIESLRSRCLYYCGIATESLRNRCLYYCGTAVELLSNRCVGTSRSLKMHIASSKQNQSM
jgi:hypothetical protein